MKNIQAFQRITSIILTVIIASVAVVGVSYALRGYFSQEKGPEQVVREFYTAWVDFEGNPMVERFYENHDLLTDDLELRIRQILDSFGIGGGFDPVLCAQDKPQSMEFVLTHQTDEKAIVEIAQDFGGNQKVIKADLVKERKRWLINEIICDSFSEDGAVVLDLDKVDRYIRENISELSPEQAVLGGTFYVTEIIFPAPGIAVVNYEDGHIALKAEVEYIFENNEVEIVSFEVFE